MLVIENMNINTVIGDMRDYPVQPKPCLTCPFEGKQPIELSANSYARYVKNLMGEGQHICHSSNGTRICRGGRNLQLKWLCMTRQLAEPTDEAFNKAVDDAMNKAKSQYN